MNNDPNEYWNQMTEAELARWERDYDRAKAEHYAAKEELSDDERGI